MFGSVLVSFQKHMEEKLGAVEWKNLLIEAGLPPDKVYRTSRFYPDSEFEKLLDLATVKTNLPKDVLYRELGKEFGDHLLSVYSCMFFPSWKTLDVIEKAAPKVYKIVQVIDLEAPVSNVICNRATPNEVVVHYSSTRMMCPYILGIIDSMAGHFGEKIEVSHAKCMYEGEPECEIHVKLIPGSEPKA